MLANVKLGGFWQTAATGGAQRAPNALRASTPTDITALMPPSIDKTDP